LDTIENSYESKLASEILVAGFLFQSLLTLMANKFPFAIHLPASLVHHIQWEPHRDEIDENLRILWCIASRRDRCKSKNPLVHRIENAGVRRRNEWRTTFTQKNARSQLLSPAVTVATKVASKSSSKLPRGGHVSEVRNLENYLEAGGSSKRCSKGGNSRRTSNQVTCAHVARGPSRKPT
jgi:hypothetical protein